RCSPVFPLLFLVCSQSGSVNSLRSQCSAFPATTHMNTVVLLWPYPQPPGTMGTQGTRLKRHELGSPHTWNRRGTLGTARGQRRDAALETSGTRFRIAGFPSSTRGFVSRLPLHHFKT